jgi:hypothetical protein
MVLDGDGPGAVQHERGSEPPEGVAEHFREVGNGEGGKGDGTT